MTGWIKLHRSIRNHWVFSNSEYLRAWVTILMEANHSDNKILISGKLLECPKGESLKSLETWGSMFGGWSKNKVYRFFKLLKKENMIELKSETVTTRLRVCNYLTYQDSGNDVGTEAELHTELHTERRRNTNKNVKNEKNVKKNIYIPKLATIEIPWIDDEIWGEWIDFKIKRKCSISERAMNANINSLEKFGKQTANEVLQQSLDSGWTKLYELKNKPQQSQAGCELEML